MKYYQGLWAELGWFGTGSRTKHGKMELGPSGVEIALLHYAGIVVEEIPLVL